MVSVYVRVIVIMLMVVVLRGVLMDIKGCIVKKVCFLEIESLIGIV